MPDKKLSAFYEDEPSDNVKGKLSAFDEDEESSKRNPGLLDRLAKAFHVASTPLVDYSSETRQAMEAAEKEHPYIGKVMNFAADTLTSGSSPTSLGLEAATLGALRVPAGQRIIRGIGKAAGAGAVAHGGYNAVQGIRQGNYPDALAGALEAGIGGLGFMGGKKKLQIEEPKPRLQLGPAPAHIANPPRFIAGPTGKVGEFPKVTPDVAANIADMGMAGHEQTTGAGQGFNPAELAEQKRIARLKFTQAAQNPGESIDVARQQPPIPPVSGDIRGGFSPQTNVEMPYPHNVVPQRLGPRAAQSEVLGMTGLGHENNQPISVIGDVQPVRPTSEPVEVPRENFTGSEPVFPLETPAAKRTQTERQGPRRTTREALEGKPARPQEPPKIGDIIDAEIVNKSVDKNKSVKQAVYDWANGRRAANQYGRNAAQDFSDLTDPSLIDKYQRGDRTGKLADVQAHLDKLRQNEIKAGVLPEDANKTNYLRQYWEDDPEKVDKVFQNIISQNPNFAKESVFKSYRQGIAAGLTPKFETLPEILEARTAESVRAIKNKQFYDYLKASGKLKPGVGIPDTQDIDKLGRIFKNPDSAETKELVNYMSNYLGDPNKSIGKVADVVSASKNIYLGGGVPGTKYNMHGWNTMKSDSKLRGFGKGIMEFITDPTGKVAEKIWGEKGNRDLLAKLMEHGYTYHPVTDAGQSVNKTFGNAVGKVLEKGHEVFEKPLFDRALPATKFKGAKYALETLRKSGMPEEEALRQASDIANEFYGGMNKVLRNKTDQDVTRIFFLAPDWLESRLKLAKHDWEGAAHTLAGKGTAKDKLYAKSLARGAGMGAVGAIGAAALGQNDKPQDITNVPMGTDAKGKQRQFDVLGTADEAIRLPLQIPLRAMKGDFGAARDMLIKNKLSLPVKSAWHLLGTGRDEFGRPLDTGMKNLKEVAAPFTYQGVQGFVDFVNDNISGEEAINKGLELPIKYESKKK